MALVRRMLEDGEAGHAAFWDWMEENNQLGIHRIPRKR